MKYDWFSIYCKFSHLTTNKSNISIMKLFGRIGHPFISWDILLNEDFLFERNVRFSYTYLFQLKKGLLESQIIRDISEVDR